MLEEQKQLHKSKEVSALMKYLHFAIILFMTNSLGNSVKHREQCTEAGLHYSMMYNAFAIAMVVINIVSLCFINEKDEASPLEYAVSMVGSTTIIILIVMMTFRTMSSTYNECVQIQFIEKQALFSSFRTIFMEVLLVFACNAYWVQRYNNSPGNIIWGYMFLTFDWGHFTLLKMLFRVIACLEVFVSFGSFILNSLLFCIPLTSNYRKALKYWWISCMAAMALLEVVTLGMYMYHDFGDTFLEVAANRMMQIFLSCNLIDLLFWLWGYLVVTYSVPDPEQEKAQMELYMNLVYQILTRPQVDRRFLESANTSKRTAGEQMF